MKKLSGYERLVVCLGLAFLLLAGGYRLGGMSGAQPYQVSVTRADQPTALPESGMEENDRPDSLLDEERIDVNRADYYDLIRLPGIGEKKARAILDWREEHGAFSQMEQLLEISGIGEKTLENLRPYITLDGAAEGG